ncbi:hypothetical protein D9Q98_001020 [Chlorella vulgaris]|uniref:pantothenate kinase n=1 Tax=Chlorella vulgaris TaxID=3077 RepID=A0A9D4Z2Y5_CHLVU|nr:hypothetical protein D9Q98_001020 [Chlorella vulgaris]
MDSDGEATDELCLHQGLPLDLTDAAISQEAVLVTDDNGSGGIAKKDAPCIVLPHQSDFVSHIALDIGGSLIKLIYFKMDDELAHHSGGAGRAARGGKLHFVKFETSKVDECIAFIEAKGLHRSNDGRGAKMRVKATGGGAYKFAELFKQQLGLIIEGEDEMACMVDGCNFLLNAVRHEAFQYENGQMKFIDLPTAEHYPYLLVNIGSGVSMVRVDADRKFQRVSGTNIGGGTFWGLCKLLTGMDNFDDILSLSSQGDNSNVDMLVGDIYGGRDYTGIGLSANTIASSFGKVINQHQELDQYNSADVVQSLCRMISYNIGQLAYLNAKRYNLSRVFFGGFFIRGHPYTMETISFAIRFWSKGEMAAMFLRHEGFLGAVGAFMKVQSLQTLQGTGVADAHKVRARFVERFSMGAPVMGGEVRGPAITGIPDKICWVEKFVEVGRPVSEAAKAEHQRALEEQRQLSRRATAPADVSDALAAAAAQRQQQRINFHVGVLHFTPSSEPFPLLADEAEAYNPSTIDINSDAAEMSYWISILQNQIPQVVEKAAASESSTAEAQRRASAFGRALDLHLTRLRNKPGAYGQLDLADLFELREQCLREFGFADIYRKDKERENSSALEVLADLLLELDELPPPQRLLALLQGVLAANIFDWGSASCVDLYQNATILEMYAEARTKLSQRPWRVDDFDEFAEVWFSKSDLDSDGHGTVVSPYQRVMIFVDNAGADVVLGILPFCRELLRMGAEVVLVANSLPAINDITVYELKGVVAKAAEVCPTIRAARDAAVAAEAANGGRVPPVPGHRGHQQTHSGSDDTAGGAACVPENLAQKECPGRGPPPSAVPAAACAAIQELGAVAGTAGATTGREAIFGTGSGVCEEMDATRTEGLSMHSHGHGRKGMFGETYPSPWRDPRLFIVPSGHGSPCLDLRRVSSEVVDAAMGTDLVVIEGMGRSVHTNWTALFKCDALKLSMIKNQHLAETLFGGNTYDCVCRFDEGLDF